MRCCCGAPSATWCATASKRARKPACPLRVYVRSDITDDETHLVFEDNGPGFAPEYLSKVFQPFATTKANGTGLGLAIVQKVIVSHNGLITAANRPEGGAQFRVRLPIAPSS